ncbi:MAG: DUF4097 family beta strand repeat-containing protein [Candidatus Zixiibacteriota bacterium]
MRLVQDCLSLVLVVTAFVFGSAVAGGKVETFTFEGIHSINIETVSGNITITPGKTDKLTVELINDLDDPEQLDPELEADEGELSIEENFTGRHVRGKTHWTVYLPKSGELRLIECSTASGDILFEGFEVDFIETESASGEVSINSLTAKELELSTASGAIMLEDSKADFVEANTASGRISASSVRAKEIDFSTASGKIEVEDCDAKIMETSTASGKISVGSVTAEELELSTASGRIIVEECDVEVLTEASCASGDVEIYLSRLPSKRLEASSASGDVDLEVPQFGDNFTMTLTKRADRGRVKCPFEYTEKETLRLHKHDKYLTDRYLVQRGEGGPEIELSTASGTIRVKTQTKGK